jgi:hypothetical protein
MKIISVMGLNMRSFSAYGLLREIDRLTGY